MILPKIVLAQNTGTNKHQNRSKCVRGGMVTTSKQININGIGFGFINNNSGKRNRTYLKALYTFHLCHSLYLY